MARDVFISYASEDLPVAEKVCAALEAAGVGCWMAPRDVPYGASYEEAIMDGIASSRLVVLVLSAHSNGSPHVKREIQNACAEDAGKQIVPLRIEDIAYNKALRYYLGSSQWLDASAPPLEQHLGRLVEHVRSTLALAGGGATRPEQAPDERADAQAPDGRAHSQSSDERARARAASLTDEAPRGLEASDVRATPRVHVGSHADDLPHPDADSAGGLPRAAIIGGGLLLLVLVGVHVAILALSGDKGGASNANDAAPSYANSNNASPTPTRTPTSTPTSTPTPTPTPTPAPTRRIIVPQGNYNIRRPLNRNN